MRDVRILCDRCGERFDEHAPSQGVTSVQVTIGGNGAAENHIGPVDMCRPCFGALYAAIRLHSEVLCKEIAA